MNRFIHPSIIDPWQFPLIITSSYFFLFFSSSFSSSSSFVFWFRSLSWPCVRLDVYLRDPNYNENVNGLGGALACRRFSFSFFFFFWLSFLDIVLLHAPNSNVFLFFLFSLLVSDWRMNCGGGGSVALILFATLFDFLLLFPIIYFTFIVFVLLFLYVPKKTSSRLPRKGNSFSFFFITLTACHYRTFFRRKGGIIVRRHWWWRQAFFLFSLYLFFAVLFLLLLLLYALNLLLTFYSMVIYHYHLVRY